MTAKSRNVQYHYPLKALHSPKWIIYSLLCLVLQLGFTQAAELEYKAPPIDNPLKGLVPYSNSAADNHFPHSLEFSYFALNEILTGQVAGGGYTFDWTAVETFLNNAKSRGNQGIFRIYSEYPGKGISIPQFLVDQGVTVTELMYGNQTAWTPDYDNALLLQAHQATIAALGTKYDGDVRVGYLELGLLGVWGEWHNFGNTSYEANAATRGALLQSYQNAFSTTKLLTRYPRGATEGARANHLLPFGYHDDSFTWSTLGTQPWKFMQLMQQAGALEKWKTEAIGGELFPELNSCVFDEVCVHDGTTATNFFQTVEATHATYMRLEGMFDAGVEATRTGRAQASVRRMGYNLYFSEATITSSGNDFTVNAVLHNRGVAPFYYNWPVTVGLIDNAGATIQEWPVTWRIDGLLPDTQRIFNQTFTPTVTPPAGAQFVVRVPNPMVGGRPVRFSNFNQQQGGQAWMVLGGADGQAPPTAPKKVLFIRGGVGTVGFFEGGADEQGADVFNYATNNGNHGWGELSAALNAEGFKVEQVAENPVAAGVPTPIPFDAMDLSQYSIIVFGSNNAEYTATQVDTFMNYIDNGGSALFISDANFGQNWGDAPSSDQHFLDRFGLTMNQDNGTYSIRRPNEFIVPSHPILNGVDEFDGEGVSPITRGTPPAGVTSTLITLARFGVRQNTGAAQGSNQPAAADDASLVVASFGAGRVAGHYDRNTFFNQNGAGTNINRLDNEVYARNLFNWLAGKSTVTSNYSPRGHFPTLISGSSVQTGASLSTTVIAKDPDGSIASVILKLDGVTITTDTTAPYEFTIPNLTAGSRTLTATVTDNLGAVTDVNVLLTVIDGDNEQALDRSTWNLSATNNAGDLAKAIDEDITSRWSTQQFQQAGQKFSIDFGSRKMFKRIVLDSTGDPNDYPRGYIVRASNNGVTFTQIAIGAGDGVVTNIVLPKPVTYRYLEIEQTGTSANNWWSIHEINVFQPPIDEVLPLSSWLQFHYEGTPPGLSDDTDGDGMTTLEEYAYNANPLDSSNVLSPNAQIGIDPNDQAPFIDYTFRRWQDSAASDVNYIIQAGNDLDTWDSSGLDLVFLPSSNPNGDGTETVTARIKFNISDVKNFVRLRLTEK